MATAEQKTSLNQEQRLGQQLSPQQVRFVRLLEMSGPEIEEEIRHEVEDNPALEANTPDAASEHEAATADFNETSDQLQAADYGNPDDTPAYLQHVHRTASARAVDWPTREQGQDAPSLVDDLNSQLDMLDLTPRTRALAQYLVGYLDEHGRMTRTLTEIATDIETSTGIAVGRPELAEALKVIKYRLEPAGIGAVDLRDCLLIQLRRKQPKTLAIRAAQEIIDQYFDLFSKKHYDRLLTAVGIDRDTLQEALDVILSLDPKPGGSLASTGMDAARHITPDFSVTPYEGADADPLHPRFTVGINQHIPRLAVEQSFAADITGPRTDMDQRMFIRRKRDDASAFITMIERRTATLVAVMQAIVTIQHRFFLTEDPADIQPMILKDVASLTGLDQSVISRATSGKYVATPGGIYPIKMFYTDSPLANDDDVSTVRILQELKAILDSEDKNKPLSDRELTDLLNGKGYTLARRTVAKYRENLNIPVARLRKQYNAHL